MLVLIEITHDERARFLAYVELHLILECAVTIAQENRKRIAGDICGDEISEGIVIQVAGSDGRRILADLIAGKVIEEIRGIIRLSFGTGCNSTGEDVYRHTSENGPDAAELSLA